MCDIGEANEISENHPPPVLRNGMDYEPKKTYPPDYSSVASVRDWQMSPFGNERFDLDEIQRLEKKGVKAKLELENLLKLRYGDKKEDDKPLEIPPACPVCKERERLNSVKCSSSYLYQPYGPTMVPSSSCATLESSRLKPYNYLGPSSYADYLFKNHPGGISPVIPCADLNKMDSSNYIPYGPSGGFRMSSGVYIPMGPVFYPKNLQ